MSIDEILNKPIDFELLKEEKKQLLEKFSEAEAICDLLGSKTYQERLLIGYDIDRSWSAFREPRWIKNQIQWYIDDVLKFEDDPEPTWKTILKKDYGVFFMNTNRLGINCDIHKCAYWSEELKKGYKIKITTDVIEAIREKNNDYLEAKRHIQKLVKLINKDFIVIDNNNQILTKKNTFIFDDEKKCIVLQKDNTRFGYYEPFMTDFKKFKVCKKFVEC